MITSDKRDHVLTRDGRQCRRCAARRHLCLDHVLPKSYMRRIRAPESAIDATWNLQTLCHDCNERKGVRLPSPRYIAHIRDIDAAYQRSAQMKADRDIEELREIPALADLMAVWEHLLDIRRYDHDQPSVLEMPQYWELDVLDLLDKGATTDDLYTAADAAIGPAIVTSAWAYFLRVVQNRIGERTTSQLLLFDRTRRSVEGQGDAAG